jgi:hypothetical protein
MVRLFSELTKDFSAERRARIDERKKCHSLQIAPPSGTVGSEIAQRLVPQDCSDEFPEYDPTSGTCKHECSYRDSIIWLANDNDSYYTQSFKTRAELEAFISKLRVCADECWPNNRQSEGLTISQDYKVLCAELLDELERLQDEFCDSGTGHWVSLYGENLIKRVKQALCQAPFLPR